MAIPRFEAPQPSRAELNEFTKKVPLWAKRRAEAAERIAKYRREVAELDKTDSKAAEEYREKYFSPSERIDDLLESARRDFTDIPLKTEEIEDLFSAEHLSSLSLKEYVELLRRVPPRFMTHVTRQGIRDHQSEFHSAGVGQMHDGFKSVLESGSLKSILEQRLIDGTTEETVKVALKELLEIPDKYKTKSEAYKAIEEFMTSSEVNLIVQAGGSAYEDRRAIHLAMEAVADENYGAERGNEVFFVFPSAFIGAHYNMASQMHAPPPGMEASGLGVTSQHNDWWLLTKEGNKGGIPIDAGLTFISAEAQVDPETGSSYETKDGKAVEDEQTKAALKSMLESEEYRALQDDMRTNHDELQRTHENLTNIRTYVELQAALGREDFTYERETRKQEQLQQKLDELIERFRPLFDLALEHGITNERFYRSFGSADSGVKWAVHHLLKADEKKVENYFNGDQFAKAELTRHMRNMGIAFKQPEHTVRSQDYWEEYFKKTGKRPAHVIYYDENSPENAMRSFKARAGLSEEGLHQEIDLKELNQGNFIEIKGFRSELESERQLFIKHAEKLLDDFYPNDK